MARRPKFNKAKWQMDRERHHLSGAYPPSKGSAEPISDMLQSFFRDLEVSDARWTDELERNWREVVGDTVATHARPGTWKDGQLTLFVDSSVWLNELKRYSEKELLAKLQAAFGEDRIRTIRLQMDPDPR